MPRAFQQSYENVDRSPSSLSFVGTNLDEDNISPKTDTSIADLDYAELPQDAGSLVKLPKSRNTVLLDLLVHLLPTGISIFILQLNFRESYWFHAAYPNVNTVIAALQVAAKIHELLLLLSFSYATLYYTSRELVRESGLPFGVFYSAYRISLGAQPWSPRYFAALRIRQTWTSHRSVLLLLAFIIASPVFFLLSGPASAILMAPKLGWWYFEDAFSFAEVVGQKTHELPVEFYIPKALFPTSISAIHLPNECLRTDQDPYRLCPLAAALDIVAFDNSVRQRGFEMFNTTYLSEGLQRQMFSRGSNSASGSVASLSMSMLLVETLEFTDVEKAIGTQFTIEAHSGSKSDWPSAPIVGTNCTTEIATNYNRSYTTHTNPAKGRSIAWIDTRSIWSAESLLHSDTTMTTWKDISSELPEPATLLAIYLPAVRSIPASMTLCYIESHWTKTTLIHHSNFGYDSLMTNFSYILSNNLEEVSELERKYFRGEELTGPYFDARNGWYDSRINHAPIHLEQDWLHALNTRDSTTNLTATASLVDALVLGWLHRVDRGSYSFDMDVIPNIIGLNMARALADAISRIGIEFASNNVLSGRGRHNIYLQYQSTLMACAGEVCYETERGDSDFGHFYFGLCSDIANNPKSSRRPISEKCQDDGYNLPRLPKPSNTDEIWTRIHLPTYRYGYSFSMNNFSTKMAAALLIAHCVFVIIHCSWRIVRDPHVYTFVGSLDKLVFLALGREAPVVKKWWKSRAHVRAFRDAELDEHMRFEVERSGIERGASDALHDAELHGFVRRRPLR